MPSFPFTIILLIVLPVMFTIVGNSLTMFIAKSTTCLNDVSESFMLRRGVPVNRIPYRSCDVTF